MINDLLPPDPDRNVILSDNRQLPDLMFQATVLVFDDNGTHHEERDLTFAEAFELIDRGKYGGPPSFILRTQDGEELLDWS